MRVQVRGPPGDGALLVERVRVHRRHSVHKDRSVGRRAEGGQADARALLCADRLRHDEVGGLVSALCTAMHEAREAAGKHAPLPRRRHDALREPAAYAASPRVEGGGHGGHEGVGPRGGGACDERRPPGVEVRTKFNVSEHACAARENRKGAQPTTERRTAAAPPCRLRLQPRRLPSTSDARGKRGKPREQRRPPPARRADPGVAPAQHAAVPTVEALGADGGTPQRHSGPRLGAVDGAHSRADGVLAPGGHEAPEESPLQPDLAERDRMRIEAGRERECTAHSPPRLEAARPDAEDARPVHLPMPRAQLGARGRLALRSPRHAPPPTQGAMGGHLQQCLRRLHALPMQQSRAPLRLLQPSPPRQERRTQPATTGGVDRPQRPARRVRVPRAQQCERARVDQGRAQPAIGGRPAGDGGIDGVAEGEEGAARVRVVEVAAEGAHGMARDERRAPCMHHHRTHAQRRHAGTAAVAAALLPRTLQQTDPCHIGRGGVPSGSEQRSELVAQPGVSGSGRGRQWQGRRRQSRRRSQRRRRGGRRLEAEEQAVGWGGGRVVESGRWRGARRARRVPGGLGREAGLGGGLVEARTASVGLLLWRRRGGHRQCGRRCL